MFQGVSEFSGDPFFNSTARCKAKLRDSRVRHRQYDAQMASPALSSTFTAARSPIRQTAFETVSTLRQAPFDKTGLKTNPFRVSSTLSGTGGLGFWILDLKLQISNLRFQISNFKFEIVASSLRQAFHLRSPWAGCG